MSDTITVTADLLAEPWTDIIDPPFGDVTRVGVVEVNPDSPNVALLVRLETGEHVVAMVSLALYVKASTAIMRARAGKDMT